MQISQIISTTDSTDTSCSNRVKPTDTTDTLTADVCRRDYECDRIYDQLGDLVNSKFRPWYIKHFYRLGKDKSLRLASIARVDGKNPPAYFSKLLKEAL